jgi:integrase
MRRRGNGEGTIYRRSDGRWGATITLEDGGRKTLYGRNRREVQDLLKEVLRQRENGLLVASAEQLTGDYLARWLEDTVRNSVRPKTFESYDLNVRRLQPLIGSVKLGSLSPAHDQSAYGALMRRGLSARSVNHAHAVLHKSLKQAVLWNLIPRNPTEAASRPRPVRTEMKTLTEVEVRRLFETTENDRLHALWVVLASTGVRLGEALGLRWEDFDLAAGRITIKRALQRHRGKGLVFVEPKTARSRRTVYLARGAVEALTRHKRGVQAQERLAAGPDWHENDLVFTTDVGRPMDGGHINNRFHRALAAARLPDLRVHDLRHTAATLLLSRGVHPKIVQELLGHSTITLTLDTYSHVAPSLQAGVADHMERLFGSPAESA